MKVSVIAVLVGVVAFPLAASAEDAGAAPKLEKCDAPKGTIAVHEPQSDLIARLHGYGLASPTAVIRKIIQESNCFQVIERGVAMQNMMQERQLAGSGMLQQDSNMGKGQMATADFLLTPNITFSENNAGGASAGMLGVFGGAGRALGALAGSLKFKEAETSMLLVDARSGIQVAAVEGKAEKTDFALSGALFGSGMAGGGGGYTNTNEGKVIVASFVDNWNKMVREIRDNPSLVQAKSKSSQKNAAASVQANAANEGDVLMPKIGSVRVLRAPKDGAPELVTLSKTDEVLYLGEEKDGFYKVQASKGEGWVKKVLVRKQ